MFRHHLYVYANRKSTVMFSNLFCILFVILIASLFAIPIAILISTLFDILFGIPVVIPYAILFSATITVLFISIGLFMDRTDSHQSNGLLFSEPVWPISVVAKRARLLSRVGHDAVSVVDYLLIMLRPSLPFLASALDTFFIDDYPEHADTKTEVPRLTRCCIHIL